MDHLDKVQGKKITSIMFKQDHGLCIYLKGGDVLEIPAPEYSEWKTVDKAKEKVGSRFVNIFINCENDDYEDRDGTCWEVNTVQIVTTKGSITYTVMIDPGDDLSTTYHKGGLNARY